MEPEKRVNIPLLGIIAVVLLMGAWWALSPRAEEADAAHEVASERPDDGGTERAAIKPVLDLTPKLDAAPRAAISGTVRDEHGKPIAGARVCATANHRDLEGHALPFPTCSESGPDGRYGIDDLWPVPTGVDASARSYRPAAWSKKTIGGQFQRQLPLRAGETTTDIDLVLRSGGVQVTGVVKDIAGGGVGGAIVVVRAGMWFRSSGGSAVVQAGAEGEFEAWVQPGDISVTATTEGYASGRIDAVAPGEHVEVYLTPESVLIGEVVHAETGKAVPDVVVDGGFRMGTTRTDDSGRFRFGSLEPGTYRPYVADAGLFGTPDEQVHLGLGQTSELVTLRVHPAAEARGVVLVAGTDEACPIGRVTFLDPKTKLSRTGEIKEGGQVTITGLFPGTYEVQAFCNGFIPREDYPDVVVEKEPLEGLRWDVDPGLTVSGEVTDTAGDPVAGIRVSARQVLDEGEERGQRSYGSVETDDQGAFEIAGLAAGRFEVSAGNAWSGHPGTEEPLELVLDDSVDGLQIELPATGSLSGRVEDAKGSPIGGAQVMAVQLDGGGWARARTNDEGRYTIEDLRPGVTRVTAQSDSWDQMRAPGTSDDDLQGEKVEILAGQDQEVNLVVARSDGEIRGTVVDELGPVADAFINAERVSDAAGSNRANARRGARWSWNEQPVLTEQDGSFVLEGLEEGLYIVRAHRKGGGEAIEEDVALGTSVKLQISTTGELAGTVLAGTRAPERFTIVVDDKVNGIHRQDQFFRTGGKWRLTQLPPGTYEVSATSSDGTAKQAGVVLGEGETKTGVDLVLSGRVTVKGRLVDADTGKPIRGLQVSITERGGGFMVWGGPGSKELDEVSDGEGRFTVEDAPVGKVRISVYDRAGGQDSKYQWAMLSRVLADEPEVQDVGDLKLVASRLGMDEKAGDLGFTVHEWDPTIEDEDREVKVALVRDDGPAADSGLEVGHVITAVDGKSVSGVDYTNWYKLARLPAGSKLKLTVDGLEAPIVITTGPPR